MLPDPIFGFIHLYGVMIAIGIILAFSILSFYLKEKDIEKKFSSFLFNNCIISIAFGFLSATIFQALYNFIKEPNKGFHFGNGMTFIGGFIGGSICFMIIYFIFRKRYKNKLADALPIIPCCIAIAHGLGRIGCFFAGCYYGKETDCFLGVQFPNLPSPVHPTQLYEATFLFLLFALLFVLVLKKNFKYSMSLYLVCYGIFRFLIEFLRGDDRGQFINSISPSQFWSILMLVGGFVIFLFTKYMDGRKYEKIS